MSQQVVTGPSWLAWLAPLKQQAAQGNRPRDRVKWSWLGDFLTGPRASGLSEAEEQLLWACGQGGSCQLTAAPAGDGPDRQAERRRAVQDNVIRAEFLRFLILGGDDLAPVQVIGVELVNAFIDTTGTGGALDLRSCACRGRVVLVDCYLDGALWVEDASLSTMKLSGSVCAGHEGVAVRGNRAKIAGSLFMDETFMAAGEVMFFSAQVDGNVYFSDSDISGTLTFMSATVGGELTGKAARLGGEVFFRNLKVSGELNLAGAQIAKGFWAQGAKIGGDIRFSNLEAGRAISLVGADAGGELDLTGAWIGFPKAGDVVAGDLSFDVSRGKIRGNVSLKGGDAARPFKTAGEVRLRSADITGQVDFGGAQVKAAGTYEVALDAQNATVRGSMIFGPGLVVDGQVLLDNAEVAKGVDFSFSSFTGRSGVALTARRAKVAGDFLFYGLSAARCVFRGDVILDGVVCGEVTARGAEFEKGAEVAFSAVQSEVKGSVFLSNNGTWPTRATGGVWLLSAHISQALECSGAVLRCEGGMALACGGARIGGNATLGRVIGYDPSAPAGEQTVNLDFSATGAVSFRGAVIGQQLNCAYGTFSNLVPAADHADQAAEALDLANVVVKDVLKLGAEEDVAAGGDMAQVPLVLGSINLLNATARSLIDGGLMGDGARGLARTVTGPHGPLGCYLGIDQFTYDRLMGSGACDAGMRLKWLYRQPPEFLGPGFRTQPFEQLVSVLRAMGNDDEADEIALAKRVYAWRVTPWWAGPGLLARFKGFAGKLFELVFLRWFVGYGYKISRGLGILVVLGLAFGWFYGAAYRQGDIVPADGKILDRDCPVWAVTGAHACHDWDATPQFNPWIYSADVMIPIVGLGQKAAWEPGHEFKLRLGFLGRIRVPFSLVYDVQLVETVLGWIGGLLVVSYVTGLLAKE